MPLLRELLDFRVGLALGHYRAQRDKEKVKQRVLLGPALGAGIFEIMKKPDGPPNQN